MIDEFLADLEERCLATLDDRDEWLAARRYGIGGSDAAAVLGWSPWVSPWALWLDKAGVVSDDQPNEAMEWGSKLEAVVADTFAERNPELGVHEAPGVFHHVEHDWMLASPDRLLSCPDRGIGYLEVKVASEFKADEWADDTVPEHYLVQWQHVAEVLQVTWGAFAVLLGGNRLVVRWMERDDGFVSLLKASEEGFWHDHVLAEVPPPMDGLETTSEQLARLYAESDPESTVELDPEIAQAVLDYHDAAEMEKEAKEAKVRAGNILREHLGEAEAGVYLGQPVVTWKAQPTTRLDVKALRAEDPETFAKYERTTVGRVLRPGRSKAALEALSQITERKG